MGDLSSDAMVKKNVLVSLRSCMISSRLERPTYPCLDLFHFRSDHDVHFCFLVGRLVRPRGMDNLGGQPEHSANWDGETEGDFVQGQKPHGFRGKDSCVRET